jgi:hypothetical protein
VETKLYTVPFDVNEMEELKQKDSITVDMGDFSKLKEFSKDPIKTMFIYLRNIEFNNLKLDFSKCDNFTRNKYMIQWLTGDIENNNEEFVNSWMDLLLDNKCVRGGVYDKSDFDNDLAMIVVGKSYGYYVYEFAYSLPLYAMSRLANNDELFDISNFESTDFDKFGPNIYKLIKHPEFIRLVDNMELYAPKFYTKYFTMENNALFEALKESPIMELLYALAYDPENPCKDLAEGVEYGNSD